MENTEQNQNNAPEPKIELDRESLVSLHETGGWANFLAILGFIFVGLLAIMGFVMNMIFSRLPTESTLPVSGSFFMILYILIAVVYFFPVYYLYKFASGIRQGIRARDSRQVGDALLNLKSHYKFIGILTIVMIGSYVIFFFLFVALGAGKMLGNTVNT